MKTLTWEQLQKENPKQTSIVVDCTWHGEDKRISRTRVVVGGWMSREEAWKACVEENLRGVRNLSGDVIFEMKPRLLRLSKVLKDFSERKPKNASAWKV